MLSARNWRVWDNVLLSSQFVCKWRERMNEAGTVCNQGNFLWTLNERKNIGGQLGVHCTSRDNLSPSFVTLEASEVPPAQESISRFDISIQRWKDCSIRGSDIFSSSRPFDPSASIVGPKNVSQRFPLSRKMFSRNRHAIGKENARAFERESFLSPTEEDFFLSPALFLIEFLWFSLSCGILLYTEYRWSTQGTKARTEIRLEELFLFLDSGSCNGAG